MVKKIGVLFVAFPDVPVVYIFSASGVFAKLIKLGSSYPALEENADEAGREGEKPVSDCWQKSPVQSMSTVERGDA